jgi:homocysteine S-methyltransferase
LSARRTTDGRVVAFHAFEDLPLDEITKFIPKTGVDVAGVMHTSAEIVCESLRTIRKTFSGPLSAYPDGGYFEMPDWKFVDVIEPTRLETFFEEWTSLGAQVIGGCCGLTVEHVDAAQRVHHAHSTR